MLIPDKLIQQKPFLGKKALVVGGTGGIGKAVALGLAERGAELTVHGGSSKERLESTLKAIKEKGGKGEGFLLSINSPSCAGEILRLAPPPDMLVCAWGPFERSAIVGMNGELWQKMADFNLVFPGFLVSSVLKGMIEKNWGRILLFGGTNTGTIRGFQTTTAYSASKTALGVIAKSVAASVAALVATAGVAQTAGGPDITCNVLCPGLTDTEYTPENLRQYNREKSPGGEPLTPEQIADAAIAILENPLINGAIIPADKGLVI